LLWKCAFIVSGALADFSAMSGQHVSRRDQPCTRTRQQHGNARSTTTPGIKAACSGASRRPPSSNNGRQVKERSFRTCPSSQRWVLLPLRTDRVSLSSSASSSLALPCLNTPRRQRVDTSATKDAGPQFGASLAEEPRDRSGHTAWWRLSSGFASVVDSGVETSVTNLYVRTLHSLTWV
jgi:hypothetical protein